MQNEGFFVFFGCMNDVVQVIIGLMCQYFWFVFGEVVMYREFCFW